MTRKNVLERFARRAVSQFNNSQFTTAEDLEQGTYLKLAEEGKNIDLLCNKTISRVVESVKNEQISARKKRQQRAKNQLFYVEAVEAVNPIDELNLCILEIDLASMLQKLPRVERLVVEAKIAKIPTVDIAKQHAMSATKVNRIFREFRQRFVSYLES